MIKTKFQIPLFYMDEYFACMHACMYVYIHMCVYIYMFMCIYGMCMLGAWNVQKRALDFLELEVKCLLDRHHVAAGKQNLFLCKSN